MLSRLYDDLADLWPVLNPPDRGLSDADEIRRLADRYLPDRGRRRSILELGVGCGGTLSCLAADFDVVGVDLSQVMLGHCRRLNPQVEVHHGDMRHIRLGRVFDIILIHDAINHLVTAVEIALTLETANVHLTPNGLLIVGPTYVRESFTDHAVEFDSQSQEDLEIGSMCHVSDPDPEDTLFELQVLLLIRRGGYLRIEHDLQICGLFSTQAWLQLLWDAGFAMLMQDLGSGRPYHLFVCRKDDSTGEMQG